MENQYIMSSEDVLNSGILFNGDEIHWGGEYGQHEAIEQRMGEKSVF